MCLIILENIQECITPPNTFCYICAEATYNPELHVSMQRWLPRQKLILSLFPRFMCQTRHKLVKGFQGMSFLFQRFERNQNTMSSVVTIVRAILRALVEVNALVQTSFIATRKLYILLSDDEQDKDIAQIDNNDIRFDPNFELFCSSLKPRLPM